MNPVDLRPRSTSGGDLEQRLGRFRRQAGRALRPGDTGPPSAPRGRGFAARLAGGPGWNWLQLAVDLAAVTCGFSVAMRWPGEPVGLASGWLLVLAAPLTIALLASRGMYARRLRLAIVDNFAPIAGALSIAAMALVLVDTYIVRSQLAPAVYVHFWGVGMALVLGGRAAMLIAQRRLRVAGAGSNTLIVGAGKVGARIARRLAEAPEYGLHPVGFLDDNPIRHAADSAGVRVLGSPEDLELIAQVTEADHVVLAFSTNSDQEMVDIVRRCDRIGANVLLVPRLFDSLNDRASYEPLGGLPLQRLHPVSPRGLQFALKHSIDRVVAAALLLALSPLMLAIAIAVKLSSPGPVLFRQVRVGRDGRPFDLLKFRSMKVPREGQDFLPDGGSAPGGVEGQDRRTLPGRILRRCSLDELPQLINVLAGQMSLVGPRPERPEFVELFIGDVDRYGDRHRVKAGITGWAQVHGLRGQTSLADRVEWDNFYIEHWSLGLDLKVLALTLVAVFRAAE